MTAADPTPPAACDVCGAVADALFHNAALLGADDRLCRACVELWLAGVLNRDEMRRLRREEKP